MSYAIGVDLGGTNIKIAIVSHDGEVLDYSTCETADHVGCWAETIKQKIAEAQNQRGEPASHIGLAAPGLAARDGLSIVNMQGRLQGLEGLVWTDFLESPRPVLVLNDAHAALLGEVWKGAAAGYRNVVLLTLGTGVGGAILADGRLLKGHIGRAGHLGHISLNPDGPPDIVGTPGSLEEMIGNCTLPARSAGRITSIINAFDPEVFIIGGGIARAGSALFTSLSNFMEQIEWRPLGHRVSILAAGLGDHAGALGAVYHAVRGAEGDLL